MRPHPTEAVAPPLSITAGWAVADSGLLLRFVLTGDLRGVRLPEAAVPGPADRLWQHTCLEAFLAVSGDPTYREFNFSPSGQWAAYRFSGERARDLAAEAAAPAVAPEMVWDTTENQAELPMTGPADIAAGAVPASASHEKPCDIHNDAPNDSPNDAPSGAPCRTPDEAPPAVAHPAIAASQPTCTLLAWLPGPLLPRSVPGQTWLLGMTAVVETSDGQLSHWALRHPTQRPDFHHRGGWLPQPGLSELSELLAAALPAPQPSP